MTQLILDVGGNNITLPESKKGGYRPYIDDLAVEIAMISGRMVKELRGKVWIISYQYGYFDDETRKKVIESCEKGRNTPITCAFLPQETDGDMQTSTFFVTSFARPKFMWSSIVTEDGGEKTVPLWGDFSVELREVRPHA